MTHLKQTPLFSIYSSLGGKIIDFGGWALPVQFSGIKAEHEAVRTSAGLFDVSHMGEITVKGERALDLLQKLMTNDVEKLQINSAQYTAMCDENGGTIDDLIIYKKKDHDYLLVVNAANTDKDFKWILDHQTSGVELTNISEHIAQLALQGPKAEAILQSVTDTDVSNIQFFKFEDNVIINGIKALVSRTGYTGEDGFELYVDSKDACMLWDTLMKAGENFHLLPCGLGARDTLRFEATLPLYGQELSKTITPLEAGIGFAVKVNKTASFIGQEALKKQKEQGVTRKIVGLEMIDKGIARTHYPVFSGDEKIGEVTTGTQSPTLKKNIALALVDVAYSKIGTEVDVEIRKKRLKAKVVATPFYKQKNKR